MSDSIFEFAQAYHSVYKDKFNNNANEMFDNLVSASGVDVEENRKTARDFRTAQGEANELQKKYNRIKTGKAFAIVGIVLASVAIIVAIVFLSLRGNDNRSDFLWELILLFGGAILLFLMIWLIKKKINPALFKTREELIAKQDVANNFFTTCMNQLLPLHRLFRVDQTYELCQKTLPEVKLDKNFSMRRYGQLQNLYGLEENDNPNETTIGIFSGEILGNPFVEERKFIQSMGSHTYTGSLVISWTTTEYDSKGHSRTVTHTQTLYASVIKPKPVYHQQTYLIFGCDAAPDLSFTHEPTHCEQWSESELARKVRRGSKKLADYAEESLLKSDGHFTELANEEFDVIFNAFDRDHEVQFRLMFTPLAQKNLMSLMRNPNPYGDDFVFAKRKKLNYISSEHAQRWCFDPAVINYQLYDIDLCREAFLNYNNDFFCNLYHELAPLMCIPLYQQHKAQEYIYQDSGKRNYTSQEAEYLVNCLERFFFMPDNCATEVILKTDLAQRNGNVDTLTVTAHGFTTIEHIEYVSTWGGDGRMHAVPVYWLEYIPVSRQSVVDMQEVDEVESSSTTTYKHGILARLLGNNN